MTPRIPTEATTRLSTVLEVARALRVSKMTIYRMVDAGTLPGYRIGGTAIRIPTAAVWNYLNNVRMDPHSLARAKALQ